MMFQGKHFLPTSIIPVESNRNSSGLLSTSGASHLFFEWLQAFSPAAKKLAATQKKSAAAGGLRGYLKSYA